MLKKRRIFKRSSVKTFSFFLVFSAIVWVLVQFSKTYTQTIEIPLKYSNPPLDKSISDEKPDHVDLQLQETGFSIYYFKIFHPELSIDLSKAEEEDNQLVYHIEDHLSHIEEELQIDIKKSRIIQDEIIIPFQKKTEKMIKVVPRIEVNYAVGYSADDPVQLKPDSVKVSGAENTLDTIDRVFTKKLTINKANQDVKGKIGIDTSGLGMLSFYNNTVQYYQKIEKFTEGSAEIPVEVLNVPEGLNLAYFPKSVIVYYQVNLKQFEDITSADFRVVCNYAEVDKGDDFMIAKIVEKPSFVTNVRLNERRIQFVIKK